LHIPDGLLDPKTWASSAAISTAAVGYAARHTARVMEERHVPTMGVLAAFIFAAQMVNFPIIGGTSGHLVGAVLAAAILGPWTAILLLTTVLTVQAFLFGDGGITALGANVLNLAIVATWSGYGIYAAVSRLWPSARGRLAGAFAGAWCSTLAASATVAVMLAVSGLVPLGLALGAMLTWHALIGLGEGAITVAVLAYVAQVRPDLAGFRMVRAARLEEAN